MAKERKSKPWKKDLLVAFAGTTLSIILTFGTSALVDRINRNKDRKLTALMVLSSIESSIRSLEESGSIMARKDTLARWLLSIPVSQVGQLPEEAILPSIMELMVNYSFSTDKTIESIFSSNTDIWKNVGNFQFIDNVGKSYASIRVIEDDWKEQMQGISSEYSRIMEHPEDYPGKTLSEKVLSNNNVRTHLEAIGKNREWLKYIAFALRESNRHNMGLIGISEDEVMAFTDERSLAEADANSEAANAAYLRGDFAIPAISRDSLYTIQDRIHILDSLLGSMNTK